MLHRSSTTATSTIPTIGILCLDEPPYEMPSRGSLYDPTHYRWPIVRQTVPGASVEAITSADPRLAESFVETARSLEARGAALIISNCGYTIAYDDLIRQSVSVPVATSSLLFLPLLGGLLGDGEKVGILTFDAGKLTPRHLTLAWPSMGDDSVRLSGLENTRSWDEIVTNGVYDWDQLEVDSLNALERLLAEDHNVAIILVECCALCSYVPTYKEHAKRPVFDIVSLANLLVEGMGLHDLSQGLGRPKPTARSWTHNA